GGGRRRTGGAAETAAAPAAPDARIVDATAVAATRGQAFHGEDEAGRFRRAAVELGGLLVVLEGAGPGRAFGADGLEDRAGAAGLAGGRAAAGAVRRQVVHGERHLGGGEKECRSGEKSEGGVHSSLL